MENGVEQLVEGGDLLLRPQQVVRDVAEVRLYLRVDRPDRPGGEILKRPAERHHRPLQLEEFTLELVDPARVGPRAGLREHVRLDLVDVLLHRVRDGQVVVHHVVRDRVQHRGRALGQLAGVGLQLLAQRAQRAVPAVPHRDHEVLADEDHDLAGVHHLAGGCEFLVLDVADRFEHREERLAIVLHLGALVGLDGVLHGQGVQVEELGDARELLVGRLVQAEPDEALALLADPLHGVHQVAARGGADTVPVRHAVHHRGAQRGAGRVTQVDARAPPGQPSHLAEAADPAEARDLPQIPCHGHLHLLAWSSSRRSRALARQSARPA